MIYNSLELYSNNKNSGSQKYLTEKYANSLLKNGMEDLEKTIEFMTLEHKLKLNELSEMCDISFENIDIEWSVFLPVNVSVSPRNDTHNIICVYHGYQIAISFYLNFIFFCHLHPKNSRIKNLFEKGYTLFRAVLIGKVVPSKLSHFFPLESLSKQDDILYKVKLFLLAHEVGHIKLNHLSTKKNIIPEDFKLNLLHEEKLNENKFKEFHADFYAILMLKDSYKKIILDGMFHMFNMLLVIDMEHIDNFSDKKGTHPLSINRIHNLMYNFKEFVSEGTAASYISITRVKMSGDNILPYDLKEIANIKDYEKLNDEFISLFYEIYDEEISKEEQNKIAKEYNEYIQNLHKSEDLISYYTNSPINLEEMINHFTKENIND